MLSRSSSCQHRREKSLPNKYSRKDIDKLTEQAKQHGAKGLAWVKVADGELAGPVAKFLTDLTSPLTEALQRK